MAFRKNSATNKLIRYIYDRGCKVVTSSFIFFYIEEQSSHQFFVASKKVGNAVYRNRSKRRLRELFRLHIKPNLTKNYSLILLARKKTYLSSFDQLISDAQNILKKIEKS